MTLLTLGKLLLEGCREAHGLYGQIVYNPGDAVGIDYLIDLAQNEAIEAILRGLPEAVGYDVRNVSGGIEMIILDGEGNGTGWSVYIETGLTANRRSNHYVTVQAKLYYNWPDGSIQRVTGWDLKKDTDNTRYFRDTEVRERGL